MCPPVRNGSIASSSSVRPQSAPMPLGPHILCPEIATKSAPSACTSTVMCGADCAASQTKIAPWSCAHEASFSTGLIVPSEFDTWFVATTLIASLLGDRVERREIELALVGQRDHRELRARASGDVLPRDEVRVVLELGDDDEVAGAEVREAPRIRDEVDRLGRVAHEDDLPHVGCVHERANLLARSLERGGRALREHVDAAVHVRVRRRVEARHLLEHLARLLRARRRVEEGERLAVDQLLEDGEVGAQRARVELRLARGYRHETMVRISGRGTRRRRSRALQPFLSLPEPSPSRPNSRGSSGRRS